MRSPGPALALILALTLPSLRALAGAAPPDVAPAAAPLRLALECQDGGRTKACPAFLLGFIEHDPLFLSSPRSDAQVILYVNVVEVANLDRMHLRFVGSLAGAPPVIETEVSLDTRQDDDDQRAALLPGFVRGAALYVAALHPDAVQITLAQVSAATIATPATSPWSFAASFGGFGNWTHAYKSLNTFSNAALSRVTRTSGLTLDLSGSYGATRQPPLEINGQTVSLDSEQSGISASAFAERHLDDHWSVGGLSTLWHEDPHGQYKLGWQARGGIEWDAYQADDPRGNHLAVGYTLGWQIDRYNQPNELGERFAEYPTHGLFAGGSVRKDKVSYGLSLSVRGELIHARRRHTVSASPFIEIQLGDHVDASLSFSLTERAVPGPGKVDQSDFQAVTRASYAEPLSANGSLSLRFHWDATNGQRNDRLGELGG